MKNLTTSKKLLTVCLLGTLIGALLSCQGTPDQVNENSSPKYRKSMETEKLIIGTSTGKGPDGSKGIYLVSRNLQNGQLSFDSLLVTIENPSFQAVSPDGKYVYSVSETSDKGGSVYAYAVQSDNSLKKINEQPSLGKSACHVAVTADQSMLFVANYSSGVFTIYHLNADGSISEPVQHFEYKGSGPHPNQKSSHPHQAAISPDQKYIYVSDLGTDEIHMYSIDSDSKKLVALDTPAFNLPPGSGPRHMVFHPLKPLAYVINELGNTIQAMQYNEASGKLTSIELYSTPPEDFDGESYCADIHISSDGKYLYGSNRGHNSLAIFRIDPSDGRLDRVGFSSVYGDWPRNFYISPDGKFVYVANQRSGNISAFNRDAGTGELNLIDSSFLGTYAPLCITEIQL